ncbi:MAG: hypothetical protein ACK5JT_12440 [Hyphomicrobiaceae bacterium]
MPLPTAPDWAHIRHAYEDTQTPVARICSDAGITRNQLDSRRRREKWRRKSPRPFPPPRTSGSTIPSPPASPRPQREPGLTSAEPSEPASFQPTPADRATGRPALLARLVAVIELKLTQLERRMSRTFAGEDDTPATDHERETRAIGVLIDNLDKLTEMETGFSPSSRTRAGNPNPADLADEAERCRRDLAERLSRIVETSTRSP